LTWGASLVVIVAAVGVAAVLYALRKRFGRARAFAWVAFALWFLTLCGVMFLGLFDADTFSLVVLGSAVVLAVGLYSLVRPDDLDVVEEVMGKEDQ
jgi:Na+/melibiose symporter-like transporter